jgi:hypothetical protein
MAQVVECSLASVRPSSNPTTTKKKKKKKKIQSHVFHYRSTNRPRHIFFKKAILYVNMSNIFINTFFRAQGTTQWRSTCLAFMRPWV